MKKGIKNGYIVKVKDGRIGMVIFKRNNSDIGINFNHYHQIISFLGKDLSPIEQRDWIMKMGVDELFEKDNIIEVIRDNEIYNL